jgi:hypothetical protein
MIDSPTWRMADRLAQGCLAERILSHRSDGLSFNAISARLYADHGIEVTGTTIGVWLAQLTEEKAA